MDQKELSDRNGKPMAQERALWEKGKLFGIKTDHEF